jgi:outer membrane lipoprotein-sorting protein
MKINILLLTLISCLNLGFSQDTEKSKKLLDKVSASMESKESIQFDFAYVLENKKENIQQEMDGKVTLVGDKYQLELLGITRTFDGEKIYTIVPENEEITITSPEDAEDIGINPSELLRFYENGYSYEWDILQRQSGRSIQFVKLIPEEKNEDVQYILLGIDINRNEVYRIIQIGENQTTTTLTLQNQVFNVRLSDDFFEVNTTDYPDYYINN